MHQNDFVQKTLQLLCLLKGKAPTWPNSRALLSPLTFKMEFSMTDVTKLRSENIIRAHEWMNTYRETLNPTYAEKEQPAAGKLLEWAVNIVSMFRYKFDSSGKRAHAKTAYEPFGFPKLRHTTVPRANAADMRLTGTRKQFESAHRPGESSPQRQIRSECVARSVEPPQQISKISTGTKTGFGMAKIGGKKAMAAGRFVPGKTFALGQDFVAGGREVPLAVLRGVGRQKALIMQPGAEEPKCEGDALSRKDSTKLGALLDKLAENKDPSSQ